MRASHILTGSCNGEFVDPESVEFPATTRVFLSRSPPRSRNKASANTERSLHQPIRSPRPGAWV